MFFIPIIIPYFLMLIYLSFSLSKPHIDRATSLICDCIGRVRKKERGTLGSSNRALLNELLASSRGASAHIIVIAAATLSLVYGVLDGVECISDSEQKGLCEIAECFAGLAYRVHLFEMRNIREGNRFPTFLTFTSLKQ